MSDRFRLYDNNTGEEVFASDAFAFTGTPTPEHLIHDPELMARYGGPAVVNRIEQGDGEIRVYIDGVEERVNAGNEDDENYRRS